MMISPRAGGDQTERPMMPAPAYFPTAAAGPADFEAIAQGAGIPKAGRIRHWFEQGWCAAARSDVLLHGGTDHALVRYALRCSHAEADDRPARRAFAKGVRAKLADYRSRGII